MKLLTITDKYHGKLTLCKHQASGEVALEITTNDQESLSIALDSDDLFTLVEKLVRLASVQEQGRGIHAS